MTSVVVVDDQATVRDGLRLILDLAGIEVVGEAADGAEAVATVLALQPDVVLMDLRMPGMDGLEATKRIVGSTAPTRVLVLTTFDHDEHVYRALQDGAAGFLLKDVRADRLVEAVRATAAGDTPIATSVLNRLVEHFVHRPPLDVLNQLRLGGPGGLTPREVEVLRCVGAGLSNAEIAAELTVSVATVKSHVRHVLAKLDLRDRLQAVVLAHEAGLVARSVPPHRPAADDVRG